MSPTGRGLGETLISPTIMKTLFNYGTTWLVQTDLGPQEYALVEVGTMDLTSIKCTSTYVKDGKKVIPAQSLDCAIDYCNEYNYYMDGGKGASISDPSVFYYYGIAEVKPKSAVALISIMTSLLKLEYVQHIEICCFFEIEEDKEWLSIIERCGQQEVSVVLHTFI